jgi:hypothetical protein
MSHGSSAANRAGPFNRGGKSRILAVISALVYPLRAIAFALATGRGTLATLAQRLIEHEVAEGSEVRALVQQTSPAPPQAAA